MRNSVSRLARGALFFLALFAPVAAFSQVPTARSASSPAEQALLLKEGRRLLESNPAKAVEIFKSLISKDSIAADYASYDLSRRYKEQGRYDEAALTLKDFSARFRYSPIKKEAKKIEIESLCHDPADKRCLRIARITGATHVPRPFRPRLEFIKAESLEASGDKAGAYRQYQRVYYHYPSSRFAEKARKSTVRMRTEDPSYKYPSPLFSQQMKRVDRLMKEYSYDSAETELVKMEKKGYGPARQKEIIYKLARAQYKGRKRPEAKKTYERYLSLYPSSNRVHAINYSIAIIDWNLDKNQEAKERLTALLKKSLTRKTRAEIHLILGRIAESEGDKEEAKKQFEQGLKHSPTKKITSRLNWRLGWLEYRNGKSDEAAKRFLEAEKRGAEKTGRFLYWGARSLKAAGKPVDAERKIDTLKATAPHTYYGAIAKREISPCVDCAVGALGSGELIRFAREYEAKRATSKMERRFLVRHHAFASAGLFAEANREADFLAAKRKRGEEEALWLGILYRQAGRSGRSIYLQGSVLSSRKMKGDFDHPFWRVFYPVDYWTDVAREASVSGIDPFLAFSVIRQESAFDPEAHSPANARGLMQIIPSTGRNAYQAVRLKQSLGKPYDNRLLFEPEVNIKLGVHYLNGLVTRYGGNITFALAAYNAGEKAVDKWISRYPNVSDDEFVEMIPYRETRGYVKRVKRNLALYHNIYLINGGNGRDEETENGLVAEK